MNLDEKQIREEYRELTQMLIQRGLSITTMESATSGQIASLITDTEGASAVFKGGFITYSNEMKIACGVDAEIIEKYSVYSIETAKAMALAAKEKVGADIAVGVTGSFGNIDPANPQSSVPGRVYFAIAEKEKCEGLCIEIPLQENRWMYKLCTAKAVHDVLREMIKE